MSIELDIASALNARLYSIVDRPPIAWPNASFDPAGAALWYEVAFLPREVDAPMLGDDSAQDVGGIYQITVATALDTYDTAALTHAGIIRDHFPRGLTLVHNSTTARVRKVSVAPGVRDGSHYRVPVSVYYRAIIG